MNKNKIHTIKVEPEKLEKKSLDYNIFIGQGLLAHIQDFLPFTPENKKYFILTDENVQPYARQIEKTLGENIGNGGVNIKVLPAGELSKSWDMLGEILDWMLENEVDRQSVLFAVGGGVVGDIAGLAAGLVMRGIPYVQIPTSLLAQIDSSVGGKTAVNMIGGKNMVGLFNQPKAVICDIDVLQTLPERHMIAGFGEMAKYGLINDLSFFLKLEKNSKALLSKTAPDLESLIEAIKICCMKKAEIVAQDAMEKGVRALLNLGHTFGHALEKLANYDTRILHGEAVALGTILAIELSFSRGVCSEEDVVSVRELFLAHGLPVSLAEISWLPDDAAAQAELIEKMLLLMAHDKKARNGHMVFILVRGIGKAYIADDVLEDDVRYILQQSFKR